MSVIGTDSPRHGGDLADATARYGEPAGGWLDLSTGINPHPYPASDITTASLARLPDRRALAGLIEAARTCYGVPETAAVAAVPGTESALRLLPHLATPGRVAIVAPTYMSHAEAWRAAGREVILVDAAEAASDAAIVVLANPNNPDGRTHTPESLIAVGRAVASRRGLLIVDEAFADTCAEISLVPRLVGLPAMVLRSFGKFYGLAGARLGFAIGHPGIVAALARQLGDWPVSTPALVIATAAFADTRWRENMRAQLRRETQALHALMARCDLRVAGGTDLFVLIEDPAAATVHAALARRGVWTRAFADNPQWLRIGLPGDAHGFARLEAALSALPRSPAARPPAPR